MFKKRLLAGALFLAVLLSLFSPNICNGQSQDLGTASVTSIKKCSFPLYVCVPELLVAKGDIDAFLKKVRASGAWGVRFFAVQSWSTVPLLPFKQMVYNGQPVFFLQPDTLTKWPVYDLTTENPLYWQKFDYITSLLWKYGLEALVSLDDYCSYKGGKETKFSYPYLCAKQAMSPSDDRPYVTPVSAQKSIAYTPGGTYAAGRVVAHIAFYRKVLDRLKGHPFRIEPINEFGALRYVEDGDPATPKAFYKLIVEGIIRIGLPQANRAELVHSGWLDACLPMGGTYCLHNVVRPEDIPDKVRYMFSGDGGTKGRSKTDVDIVGRRGLSVADGRKIARIIMQRKAGGYEIYVKSLWKVNDCLANVNFMQYDVLTAMTAESLK